MKRLLATIALLLLGAANGITLDEALESAPARPEAITTRLELLNARNELVRVESDPLALRMEKLQAQQAVELLESQLVAAQFSAQLEIAQAYSSVLEARAQRDLALKGVELSEVALEIAHIRLANGGATQLDVSEAEVALDEAGGNRDRATSGLGVALANLEGMVGSELEGSDLEPVPDSFLVEVPGLEQVLAAVAGHPDLLQARQGLQMARVGVDLLDPAYASRSQIDSAQTQLATATELVEEAERGFRLQARNAHIQAEGARETLEIERERLANARQRLEVQGARLDAGLISEVQYQQADLEALQAELALTSARHAFLTSLLQLQSNTLVELGDPYPGRLSVESPR